MRKENIAVALLCASGLSLLNSSCVNDDYDLSGDIDMTIQIGGNVTLPYSTTDALKMKDILDLEDDDIIRIRENDPDSVYYLIKHSDEQMNLEMELPEIKVEKPTLDPFKLAYTMPTKEELLKTMGLADEQIQLVLQNPSYLDLVLGDKANDVFESDPVELHPEIHLLDQQFNLPEEVVALNHIGFSEPMKPDFWLSTNMEYGTVGMHNVTAEFPGDMVHDNVVDGGWWEGHKNEEGHHVYNLPKDKWLVKGDREHLTMEFIGLDFSDNPWLRTEHPDGDFHLKEDVQMYGTVTIKATAGELMKLAGNTYHILAEIVLEAPKLGDVTVIVDPKIDTENTTVELNDLPDFLTDNDVSIVLQSPTILLEVDNNSPLEVNCWGELSTNTGFQTNVSTERGTDLQISGNGASQWCIYDGIRPEWEGYKYYQAENLRNILREIPEKIDLAFDAQVNQIYYTLQLGKTYSAKLDYRMECPLALANESQIVYTEIVDEWNEDIADYEAKKVKLTATLKNDTPLDELDLTVQPIDVDKQPLSGISVTPLEKVKDGDNIEVILICEEEGAMRNLDGIELTVTGRVTEEHAEPLKANSTVQFTNIRVSVEGGVIADLN